MWRWWGVTFKAKVFERKNVLLGLFCGTTPLPDENEKFNKSTINLQTTFA